MAFSSRRVSESHTASGNHPLQLLTGPANPPCKYGRIAPLMKTFQLRHTLPIYSLFVVSGFCALVYETVWLRYFAFYCGNTTFASTSIFTAFMAGLGIGSYLIGKRVDLSPHPLRVYAALELAIGVYALLLPELIRQFKPYFGFLTTHLENHFLPLNIARFCLVFVLLIFPTSM